MEHYIKETNHLRHNQYAKSVYSRRKETIERVFADAKEQHGMRYTHLRDLAKLTIEVTLIFTCMNLKKLAKRKWIRTGGYRRLKSFIENTLKYLWIFQYKITNSIFVFMQKCYLSTN